MSEKISYDDLLYLFEQTENVDETAIYFDDDPEEYGEEFLNNRRIADKK